MDFVHIILATGIHFVGKWLFKTVLYAHDQLNLGLGLELHMQNWPPRALLSRSRT